MFGNGGAGGPTNTLFFTAGINHESDGLFSDLTVAPGGGDMASTMVHPVLSQSLVNATGPTTGAVVSPPTNALLSKSVSASKSLARPGHLCPNA
jgi:hypothetical protein